MTAYHDSVFTLLDQHGPFATLAQAPDPAIFAPQARQMTALLHNRNEHTKYRVLRNQVFDLLGISSFAEIAHISAHQNKLDDLSSQAYQLLGNMFGIDGGQEKVIATINNYSRTADGVIRYLKGKVLANFASHIEMTNEIDAITNPVQLLLIIFSADYHQKARFEAKRKLLLMNLAGSIDQRERETNIEAKFSGFLDFLNEHVWAPDLKIGELELVYILSRHRPTDFSCASLEIINPEQAATITLAPGEKLTLLKRRRFTMAGQSYPIYVSIRKKPPEAKVLKLLRKGEENPAVAVDDELGLMGVLDNLAQVKAFQNHLTHSAIAADSFMVLEDIADSLTSGSRPGKNIGSSSATRMLKFFARLGGMRVEFIVHTNESYLNYIYQRDVAHDEYEVKRIFDSGVARRLFPPDIYHLDLDQARAHQLQWFRRQLEE